ncbi:MAG: InlB B-repeat-containing protein [Clostridium sp.]|nr:InlB B-repeat-containing protein [Clostridium sp.]MCM1398075.1 InlB B-repeat-containing protein [Clostridium sp.]MCM1459290.1 InlB B-repeat-containing protein [Bacteroides sp.]
MIGLKRGTAALLTLFIMMTSFGMADMGICHAISMGETDEIATDGDAAVYEEETSTASSENEADVTTGTTEDKDVTASEDTGSDEKQPVTVAKEDVVTKDVNESADSIYYVLFDGNGATEGSMTKQEMAYGKKVRLSGNEFHKKGYTFIGWNTKADGSGKTYKDKGAVKNLTEKNKGKVKLYAQWEPNQFYVKFNGNGSTEGSMKKMTFTYGAYQKLTANAFTRKGYQFVGWNTKADGSGKAYTDGKKVRNLSTENGATKILYAQWKKIKYKITYELDGGVNNSKNPSYYYVTSKKIILAEPEKKGYTFEGWYKDKKLTKKVTRIYSGSEGKRTFYAKWTPNKYRVKFDGNGSTSGSMKKLSFTYGQYKTLTANTFTRKGYTFAGWNTKADGSGKAFTDGKKVRNLSAKNGGTIILYAQWKKIKYKITYQLDGGTNNSKNPSYYYVTSKKITLADPTKKGYTFQGWYKDKKLTKQATRINSGSTGTKTFYAKWTPNKYYVKFDLNGSTGTAMKKKTYTYDKSYRLPECSYTRRGYTFAGWNTKADGSGKSYADGAKVKNLYSTHKGTRVLYAQWKPIRYTVKYVLNGGKNASGAADHYYTNRAVTLKTPTRSGYTFAGWYKESTWINKVTKISTGQIGNKTFYAKWTPKKYTYTFNGNGNTSGAMNDYTASIVGTTYGIANDKKNLKVIDVSSWQKNINWNQVKNQVDAVILRCGYGMDYTYQDDYEFERNAAECERLGIPYGVYLYSYATNDSKAKSEAAHILRLLKGKKVTLPVYLDCEEGNTAGYAARACEVIGNIIQNAGYMFGVYANTTWWNNYLPTVTGYTRWVAQYFSICQYGGTYDAWQYSSSGSVTGISGNVDMNIMYTNFQQADVATYTLPKNEYKKNGYTFMGWNTKADGSGTAYADEASIKSSSRKNGAVTLYAQWKATVYTISYVLNDGKNSTANPSKYTIESQNITLAAPKKTGYTFEGWYRDEAFKKPVAGINTGSTGNRTFYAKWSGNPYTVRFDGNGSTSGSMADQSLVYGNSAKKLRANAYKRTGYDFAGWSTKANGKGTAIANKGLVGVGENATPHLSKKSGAVVILYAQWTAHEYTITYELNGGTNNKKNPESYNVEKSFKIYAPTRDGYDFAGWYTDKKLATEFNPETLAATPKNLKLYAKWNVSAAPVGSRDEADVTTENGTDETTAVDNITSETTITEKTAIENETTKSGTEADREVDVQTEKNGSFDE